MARIGTRIRQMIEAWDPVLRRAFEESIQNLRGTAHVSQIEAMLRAGNVDGAIRAVGLDPVAFRPLDRAISSSFEAGGAATAGAMPAIRGADGFRTIFQFDVRNPAAERWLSDHSSRLVTDVLNDQRQMIRNYLTDGLARGDNPRTSALDLVGRVGADGRRTGGVIGLTDSQAGWVRRYEAELASSNPMDALQRTLRDRRFDATVRKYAEVGQPVPAELRSRMVDAYENRALRFRAEAIARTETMASLHEAQQQAMEQAVATGSISRDQVSFVWRATADSRTRDSHAAMDGQERAMGETFTTGDGNELEYPGDPSGPPEEVINCRCWREPNVDFLAGIE